MADLTSDSLHSEGRGAPLMKRHGRHHGVGYPLYKHWNGEVERPSDLGDREYSWRRALLQELVVESKRQSSEYENGVQVCSR